jgi:hypothetical protein
VKSIFCAFLILALANLTFAEETTFSNVKVPHRTGRQTKAVLTFSDSQKAILVRPVKGDPLTVPYSELDKCSYQFSRKHRVTLGFIVLAIGADPFGFLVMLSTSKLHWLEVDYHEQDARRNFVLRMDKHNYPQILDAMKAHTGIEPEVLGNVDKRSK